MPFGMYEGGAIEGKHGIESYILRQNCFQKIFGQEYVYQSAHIIQICPLQLVIDENCYSFTTKHPTTFFLLLHSLLKGSGVMLP